MSRHSTISKNKEAITTIHWIRQLLLQLHTATVLYYKPITWVLRLFESRQTDQSNRRITRELQSDQRSTSGNMRISSQTTNHSPPIRPHNGCQFPRFRLCAMIEEDNKKKN